MEWFESLRYLQKTIMQLGVRVLTKILIHQLAMVAHSMLYLGAKQLCLYIQML